MKSFSDLFLEDLLPILGPMKSLLIGILLHESTIKGLGPTLLFKFKQTVRDKSTFLWNYRSFLFWNALPLFGND